MASYLDLLQQTKPQFESPAKVFAKLKSKVQKEAMCAKDGNGPPNNAREEHRVNLKSPRKQQQRIWVTDEFDENQRFGSEAQPLILSPIKSPQKTSLYSYSDFIRKSLEETPPVVEMGLGCTRSERRFLESTAVSHPLFLTNHIHKEPPQVRDSDRFIVSSRTPLKVQPVESDCKSIASDEECAPLHQPVSTASAFSPMVKRLRKRKWEQQEFNKVNSTEEVRNEFTCQPRQRKAPALSEENTHSTWMNIRGCSADQPERIPENMFTPRKLVAERRCGVVLEKIPIMSPAKMFAYMKERESKRERRGVHEVINTTRDIFNAVNSLRSGDSPLSTPHSVAERDNSVFTDTSESDVPVSRRISESADCQSDADPAADALTSAVSAKPVLLEDPLVLNSPQILVPKRQEAVFKCNKWPKQATFPSESVIYLKKWFLRKNSKGLFVDGIHGEDNIPWNSNVIMHRVSKSTIKTISGRVYILVGKMNLKVESEFPRWFLKKFERGFPPNWKALYDKMLTESRDNQGRGRQKKSESSGIKSKQKSEASVINSSVKQQTSFMTPDSCPPMGASSSSMKVSRSGRVIKPPLEYWKGGRVILDAFMNVTIHECYNTSICNSEVNTTLSTGMSQEPVRVFLPCSEGEKEASVSLRKVKAPLHRRNRVKAKPDGNHSDFLEPAAELLRSPEEGAGRITRSGQKCPAKERELHVDTVLKHHSDNEKSSAQRSQKRSQGSCRASARLSKSKQAVINSPETPPVKILQQLSSNDELSIKRKKRGHSKDSRNAHRESKSSHSSAANNSPGSEEQNENREYSAQKSQKHGSHATRRPAKRVNTRKQMVTNPLDSPLVNDETSQNLSSDDELPMRRRRGRKGAHSKSSRNARSRPQPKHGSSSTKSEDSDNLMRHKPKHKSSKSTRAPAPTKTLAAPTQSSKKHSTNEGNIPPEHDEDKWTEAELMRLQEAVSYYPKHMANYWAKVARMVGTRTAEECHSQHTSQGASHTPAKKATKPKKKKMESPKAPDHPVISARAGTLKRKQQVRQFLETMPRDNVDDVFSSEYMQNKRFELRSLCSEDEEDLAVSDLEPLTPMPTRFPEVKTPQCLHITPGMMGSPNRDNDDKYVYQLQKRIKKNQFNACKLPPPSKSFTPTPSVKRTMRRCGNTENDTFVVWEMFPGNNEALSESEEEEDFYFSDND